MPPAHYPTSVACGFCGSRDEHLGFRTTFRCHDCDLVIDRDVNGTRNNELKALVVQHFVVNHHHSSTALEARRAALARAPRARPAMAMAMTRRPTTVPRVAASPCERV